MQNKINSVEILISDRNPIKIHKVKSLRKYIISQAKLKQLNLSFQSQGDSVLLAQQEVSSNYYNQYLFSQPAKHIQKKELSKPNKLSSLNRSKLLVKSQNKSNIKILWQKAQKGPLKKLQPPNSQKKLQSHYFRQLNREIGSQSCTTNSNYIKAINIELKSQKNYQQTKTTNRVNFRSTDQTQSPYATFGYSLMPRTQLKVSKWSKKNKLFQDADIFNPQRQITIKNALQKIRLKYSTLKEIQYEQMVSINTIQQNQHPGPALKRQRKNILLSISQSIKNTNLRQKIIKFPLRQNQTDIEKILYFDNDKVYAKKIISFLEFVLKVNYSNKILKQIKLSQNYSQLKKHKVFVGPGNNKFLIVGLLKRRYWLQIVYKMSSDVQFFWTQNSLNEIHKNQQQKKIFCLSNAIKTESKQNISKLQTKPSLQQSNKNTDFLPRHSLQFQCQSGSISKKRQIQFRLKTHSSKRIKNGTVKSYSFDKKLFINKGTQEKAAKYYESRINRILNKISSKKNDDESTKTLKDKIKITNHIPSNSYIGSKKALFYTLQFYYTHVKKMDPFSVLPKTYHISSNNQQSYDKFMQGEKQNSNSIWIVKPGQYTNRGHGISLIKNCDISANLLKKQYHKNGQIKTMIVQSYITNPLLYYGRKFDIRHYMMITVVNGNIKAYWYLEGYVRTCSQIFTLSNLSNVYIHLTNDAVQKNSQNYGKYEPGNKISYSQLQRYLDSELNNSNTVNGKLQKKTKINFKQKILKKMKEITLDVIKANYFNLDKDRKQNNFQIFGMDFLIDTKYNVWLIQINSNPCLQLSCPLLSRIIPNMVQHSLRLGLDPLILPQSHCPPNKRYYLSDNILQNFKYQIIFDQLEENHQESLLLINKLNEGLNFKEENILEKQNSEDLYQNQGKEIDLTQYQEQQLPVNIIQN